MPADIVPWNIGEALRIPSHRLGDPVPGQRWIDPDLPRFRVPTRRRLPLPPPRSRLVTGAVDEVDVRRENPIFFPCDVREPIREIASIETGGHEKFPLFSVQVVEEVKVRRSLPVFETPIPLRGIKDKGCKWRDGERICPRDTAMFPTPPVVEAEVMAFPKAEQERIVAEPIRPVHNSPAVVRERVLIHVHFVSRSRDNRPAAGEYHNAHDYRKRISHINRPTLRVRHIKAIELSSNRDQLYWDLGFGIWDFICPRNDTPSMFAPAIRSPWPR